MVVPLLLTVTTMPTMDAPDSTLQTNESTSPASANDDTSSRKDEGSPEPLPKGQGDIDAYATTFQPGWRFYLAFSSLLVITLMAALDATSLSVAIPKITTALNGSAIEGFWSGTSFLLTSTGAYH